MASATEAELAHARDVTITECQEHLRRKAVELLDSHNAVAPSTFQQRVQARLNGRPLRSAKAVAAAAKGQARTLRNAAEDLETLRVGFPHKVDR
jgi:hypothetical protein